MTSINPKVRFWSYILGLVGAVGITGALQYFSAMGAHEPKWLIGAAAAWVTVGGVLHLLAAGNVPDFPKPGQPVSPVQTVAAPVVAPVAPAPSTTEAAPASGS